VCPSSEHRVSTGQMNAAGRSPLTGAFDGWNAFQESLAAEAKRKGPRAWVDVLSQCSRTGVEEGGKGRSKEDRNAYSR
jgi:hypothetical protein